MDEGNSEEVNAISESKTDFKLTSIKQIISFESIWKFQMKNGPSLDGFWLLLMLSDILLLIQEMISEKNVNLNKWKLLKK